MDARSPVVPARRSTPRRTQTPAAPVVTRQPIPRRPSVKRYSDRPWDGDGPCSRAAPAARAEAVGVIDLRRVGGRMPSPRPLGSSVPFPRALAAAVLRSSRRASWPALASSAPHEPHNRGHELIGLLGLLVAHHAMVHVVVEQLRPPPRQRAYPAIPYCAHAARRGEKRRKPVANDVSARSLESRKTAGNAGKMRASCGWRRTDADPLTMEVLYQLS
jgi:hypothetical protein